MSTNLKLNIRQTPNWILETANCILEKEFWREKEVIENSEKFGMKASDMKKFLSSLSEYKTSVLKELIPIYQQYPLLQPFFQVTEQERETEILIYTLLLYRECEIVKDISQETTDRIMNEFIKDIIEELEGEKSDEEIKIRDISGVIGHLSRLDLVNDLKIKIIELYNNRYAVIPNLKLFLEQGAVICEKYFYILKEDFEKELERLKDWQSIEKLVKAAKICGKNNSDTYNMTISLTCFNQISLQINEDKKNFYYGIYLAELSQLKDKNKLNDVQLCTDLKAVSDATRLKILRLLSERKQYLQELADELKLTPATISHHMEILRQSELVAITLNTESKKVVYEVNQVKLNELGESLKNLTNLKNLSNQKADFKGIQI